MDAYPLYSWNLRESPDQFGKATLLIKIQAIISRVLGNQNQLPNALGRKVLRFLNQFLDGNGSVCPTDERYGTVGAAPVAAFRDLKIGRARSAFGRLALKAFRVIRLDSQITDYRIEITGSEPGIHLRDKRRKLMRVTLAKAAEHDKFAHQPTFLHLYCLQNSIYALLLGIADETAGVHQKDIDCIGRSFRQNDEISPQLREEMFGVDSVFRTAESDRPKLPRAVLPRFQNPMTRV